MIKKVILFITLFYINSELLANEDDQQYVTQLLAKILGYRLPNDTIPVSYALKIEPHIEDKNFNFDGEGILTFEVQRPTNDVTLHAKNLEIDKSYTKLIGSDGNSWTPTSQRWNSILEFFNIRFDHQLSVGRYSLKLKWKGFDADNWRGFYRAADMYDDGHETFMAATHFQPSAARKAFPCWDEPGLKAEFEITLKHYPNYTALSNMPVQNQIETDDGKILTNFQKSPMMSTYLVTFVVADYDHIYNEHGNITFYTTKEKLYQAELAFKISEMIVNGMENYTGILYSLPKLDQVAIPQYSSAASEHWGIISYSNTALVDVVEKDIQYRDRAMFLVAHEVSHQWFGNLVTPAWWGDLWLSEAFAVYFSYKITDLVIDEWYGDELFMVEVVNYISYIAEKQQRIPRPIKWHPKTPGEVSEMFSLVTYRKGAAVVRMLEHIITKEVFRDGLSKYLNKHLFSVVTTDDLWRALQEAYKEKGIHPHLNIKEIMDPWLEQTGHPLLTVTRDYKTGITNVTQSNEHDPESDNLWMIPVTLTTSTHPDFAYTKPTHWIPRSRDNYTFYGIDKDDWMILNIQQTGFYRVNYDYENWKRLADYLNTDNYHKIHVINRAQLIFDIITFVRFDPIYVELGFDILLYLERETNFLPWAPLTDVLDMLSEILINTPVYNLYSKLMLHLMNNIINRIGFDKRLGENHLDQLARYELLPWACTFDHEECKAAARSKLLANFRNPQQNPISPQEEVWVYCNGLQASNESVWEEVMNAHLANPLVQPGFEYLGCTDNHYLMKKYLSLAMAENSTVLKDQISDAFESLIVGKQENLNFGLNYFIDHIDEIREYYNKRNITQQIYRIVRGLSNAIKTADQYNQFVDFITSEEKKGKMADVDYILDNARTSMDASEKVGSKFYTLLSKKPALFNLLQG